MKTRTNAGMTLLEVLIASAILAVVLALVFSSLVSSSGAAQKGSITSGLEERGRKVTDLCRVEFLQAQFTGAAPTVDGTVIPVGFTDDNTAMVYRMPGTVDPSGAALPGGTVVYGYTSPRSDRFGFRQDLVGVLRFEAENVLRESAAAPGGTVAQPVAPLWGPGFPPFVTLNASTQIILNTDVNRDGDRLDLFVRGKLRRYYVAPDGHPVRTTPTVLLSPILSSEIVTDNMVLAVSATGRFNGLIDNDGIPDGLFRCVDENGNDVVPLLLAASGRSIQVTAWHGAFDDTGKNFMVRKVTGEARWRNAQ